MKRSTIYTFLLGTECLWSKILLGNDFFSNSKPCRFNTRGVFIGKSNSIELANILFYLDDLNNLNK